MKANKNLGVYELDNDFSKTARNCQQGERILFLKCTLGKVEDSNSQNLAITIKQAFRHRLQLRQALSRYAFGLEFGLIFFIKV